MYDHKIMKTWWECKKNRIFAPVLRTQKEDEKI